MVEMRRVFIIVTGEGECVSWVGPFMDARAFLQTAFYGKPGKAENVTDHNAEWDRWKKLAEPTNWFIDKYGRPFEHQGIHEDSATVRAFFINMEKVYG